MENYYKILGIEENATKEEIKKAYDKKIFKTDTVESAYKTLIVDKTKEEYDKYLEENKKKNYYELLNVERTCTTQDIIEAYYKIPEEKRTEEITKAFNKLSNPKKRSRYNIRLGIKELKKEESTKFKKMVSTKLENKYDNYSRNIYIAKYENRIEFIKKQIEIIQNEKDKKSFSYRIRISNLVTKLELAQDQLDKWTKGRENVVATKITKKKDTVIYKQVNGKGEETSFVSKILSKSIENIDKNEKELQREDVSTLQHINLNIKNGFWKNVKKVSSGTIKMYATTWSKVQDIVIHKPNFITALKETEEELEERLTKAVR